MALRKDELTGLCDDVDLERDRVLVERCQAGDSSAFGHLYSRHYERLLRFSMRRLGDRHEAEDATQEAFARAWKALPRFGGDKRFYPWLTVIAGNLCTDMLRRRSRSTPTEDVEITAQRRLAVVDDTSEDLVMAAVDGELVNRAFGRLSERYRHVLAMREGSDWTYQQIADHEGVEIGTVETLLWRARRALKREFAAVSESKGALAGFLAAAGSLFRRTLFRAAHRGAGMQQQSGASGGMGMRNALAGVAVAGAAVAAAFIAPHALRGNDNTPTAPAPATPPLAVAPGSAESGAGSGSAAGAAGSDGALPPGDAGSATPGGADGLGGAGRPAGVAGDLGGAPSGAPGGGPTGGSGAGTLGGAVNRATGGLNGALNNLGTTVNGVTDGVGSAVDGVTGGLGGAVKGVTGAVDGTVNSVSNGVSGLSGDVSSGSGPSGSGSSGSGSSGNNSTTTTLPNVLKDVGDTVGGLLGG